MLVAAAACPCPPLLVPEVAAGAAPELDAARAACTDALGVLAAARPDLLVVVGPDDGAGTREYPAGTPGSFRGFGVGLDVRLGEGDGVTGGELPYGLAVGAWLLGCGIFPLSRSDSLTVTTSPLPGANSSLAEAML
ncbi:hypothetical protein ABZ465_26005, partial [Streptomyces griseoincarnatus]